MKEKVLMTSFLTANLADISTTAVGLSLPNFKEINPTATELGLREATVIKMAITAILIGSYALAEEHKNHLRIPLRKAVNISNFIVWGAVVLNTLQIVPEIVQKLR